MTYGKMLELLFTPLTAVFFAIVLGVCVYLLIKKKVGKAPLIIIICFCLLYFVFVLWLSTGFGQSIPPAAPPAMPQ